MKAQNRYYQWSADLNNRTDYSDVFAHLVFLEKHLFDDYEPTVVNGPRFLDRLEEWLDSAPDEDDRKLMVELTSHIYFVGLKEFQVLYEAANSGPITTWLLEQSSITLDDPDFGARLQEAVDGTWFCPITDSLQIARFHHLNRLEGHNLRPDWHTLRELGDPVRIREYMDREGLDALVLLEDFVGSGKQAAEAAEWALEAVSPAQVLLTPLLCCPEGTRKLRSLAGRHENLTFRPLVELPERAMLGPEPQEGEPDVFAKVRSLLERVRDLVNASYKTSPGERDYGFGETGALSVLYSNCPNNVLPMVHNSSDQWSPLFPRSSRK